MKNTLRYEQPSCRLLVEGLPDASIGQGGDAVGIITTWRLAWSGRPELEGRKEHLLAMMQVVLPYARHLISGVGRPFGDSDQPVRIGPDPEASADLPAMRHRLELHSSQPNTPPLLLSLDDAELSDLVRVLDLLRHDRRLQIKLEVPEPQPLRPREVLERVPRRQRLVPPLAGAVAVALVAGLSLLLGEPAPREPRPAGTAATAAPAASPEADAAAP